MLTKFETKSNRVKGVAFHTTRPWVLSSLHNGVIQLWDFRMGTLLESYQEHDGPVRGIDFHDSQPLFASGGDDYKIKVWNFKLGRCLFTLLGHLDYIRTVQFHHEYPWIISASDDQTVRIWNWQSRNNISILTGHNHYVMCAKFHPSQDLIVSASLDQTVRVWDMSGLRKKTVRGAPQEPSHSYKGDNALMNRVNSDLFGGNDAIVKYVLEGHERGVNWAEFHHTLPMIISASDDRQIKLWRMNDSKAWEVDNWRGHTNIVSCVIFHPKKDLVVSNSEDRSIRIWDLSRRQGIHTFKRDEDRFWILTAHKKQNLLAAGHDQGMTVFKLERERPAYNMQSNTRELYYVKDNYLKRFDYSSSDDSVQIALQREDGPHSAGSSLGKAARTLIYNTFNPQEINILVLSDVDNGTYELIQLANSRNSSLNDVPDTKRGSAKSAVFIARNKFVILDWTGQLLIKNMRNEVTKRFPAPPGVEQIFPCGQSGRLLLKCDDRVILFDTESRKVISEVVASNVRYVCWSTDGNLVAFMSKHAITICNKQLEQQCSISETVRVKSGTWAMNGVFVYATMNHIKYCIANGDNGVIRTLDLPIYITRVTNDTVYCLNREYKVKQLSINMTECIFKLALMRKQYGQVVQMIRNSSLCGHAIIAYLKQKGYPEVALHFVEDKKTRFNLAIECGNLDIAQAAALEVNSAECWKILGEEALRQGNHKIVEMAYQQTRDFEKLSFLYLITGNRANLHKMLKIAEKRNDAMSRFHNALYIGSVEERILIMEDAGQYSLAYVAAVTHGLDEAAERIKVKLEEAEVPVPNIDSSYQNGLLVPPNVIARYTEENWPQLQITRSAVQEFIEKGEGAVSETELMNATAQDPTFDDGNTGQSDSKFKEKDSMGDSFDDADDGFGDDDAWGGDDDDDLDIDLDDDIPAGDATADDDGFGDSSGLGHSGGVFVAPIPGPNKVTIWMQNSSVVADHVAAGNFESAMKLLNRQIGVTNFIPLRDSMLNSYLAVRGYLHGFPNTNGIQIYLQRNDETSDPGKQSQPYTAYSYKSLSDPMRLAYRYIQGAKFAEALDAFRKILVSIPLVVVPKCDVENVKNLLKECREYILGVSMELARRKTEDPVRQTELAAYFTRCELQSAHLLLVLNSAMTRAFKLNNFITAASFAERLLNMREIQSPSQAKNKDRAEKVLRKSEVEARNEKKINYPEKEQFQICCVSYSPITIGQPSIKCPFCGAVAKPEANGKMCPICTLSPLGVETLGLICTADR